MSQAPYIANAPSVTAIMFKVLLALVPGIAAYVWVFGGGVLVSLTLATLTALITEAAFLKLRQRPLKPYLGDLSAVVTAWLIALALPPLAPWWLVVIGTFFAIGIAKQLYGGLGYNPFNPAMVAYAVLLISFPAIMTKWPIPLELGAGTQMFGEYGFLDQMRYLFSQTLPLNMQVDAITSATPLDYVKTQLTLKHPLGDIMQAPIFGHFAGKGAEYIGVGYLLGGLYLWQQRIISWHLPVAFLATLGGLATLFNLANDAHFTGAAFHLLSGASMLCAFFIITDPVSGPTTPKGKLIFAVGVGLLTYFIRTFGGYPDGVAFAVLIMNMCVPLIDAYTQPRVFGHLK